MTKAELIEKMAKDANISKAAASKSLASFLDGVTKALKKRNGRLTIVGFGTFKKVYRKTRKGINPQTGEKIKIKGRNTVTFKPGKTLRDKI
jgi:DNA-binding protein HU-beta